MFLTIPCLGLLMSPTPCRNFQTNKSFQNANFSTLIIMLYLMVCILPYFRMGMCFKSHKEKWLISYFLIHLILWPDPRMSNLSPLSHADLPKAVWSAWSKSRSVWSASFTLDIALMNEIPQQCLHRHLGISLSKHTHNSLSPTQKGISAIHVCQVWQTVPVGDDTWGTTSYLFRLGLHAPYLVQNSKALSENSEHYRAFLISESPGACGTSTSCITGIGNTVNTISWRCFTL